MADPSDVKQLVNVGIIAAFATLAFVGTTVIRIPIPATGGYFVFEAYIYPLLATKVPFFGVTDPKAAMAEIIPNLLQGIMSAVIALGIWRVFRKKAP